MKSTAPISQAAVALILSCVAILLTSACGFGPTPQYLSGQNFLLREPGSRKLIGYGHLEGQVSHPSAGIILFDPPCPYEQRITLSGNTVKAGGQRTFALTRSGAPHPGAELTGTLLSTPPRQWKVRFPLAFRLDQPSTCGAQAILRAEGSDGPDLSQRLFEYLHWPGHEGGSVLVDLFQTAAHGSEPPLQWSHISFTNGTCFTHPFTIDEKAQPVPHAAARTFPGPDGSTIRIDGLPTTLDPTPRLKPALRVTITGGPCDGQTATNKTPAFQP